jgi:hypothetical protein
MQQGDDEKCIEAGGQTFPADDQAAVLPLEPGKGALGLKARNVLPEGTPTWFPGVPHPLGNLGPNPTFPESLAKICGIIPFVHGQHLEPFAWSAPCTRADAQGIQQRDDLGPLVTIGGRGARGQRHASGVREAVDEDAFAFPAIRDALTAPFARGKRSHPQRRTATESSRVPRPAQVGALA